MMDTVVGLRRAGFSIVEAILSAGLLALLICTLFNLFPTSMLSIRRAEHRLVADNLARSQLELLRSRPFTQLTPQPPTEQMPGYKHDDGTVFQTFTEVRDSGPMSVEVRAWTQWTSFGKRNQITHAVYVSKVAF